MDGDADTITQYGDISGIGGLTKTGDGTLRLTNADLVSPSIYEPKSTYSGDTNVNRGILENTGNLTQTNVIAKAGAAFYNVFVDSLHKGYVYKDGTASAAGSNLINDSYVLGDATATGDGSTFTNNLLVGNSNVPGSGNASAMAGGTFNNGSASTAGNANHILGNATAKCCSLAATLQMLQTPSQER